MRLKTIEIAGFKSFADRIKLSFSKGITIIVGPNGCGKSNIAEAFCWVLGEQSVKSLRSSRMSDIIFSGTTQRKPLAIAEVTITLTDIEDELPLPYEEISITRRLHRDGNSEYFINGQSVRLKDILSLFMGTGLGKNALSIFEQGKMDQVIHYTPQERRLIFEEVAGTSRLVQKRQESAKKLELLQNNLERLYDIAKEVSNQIAVMEKQATAAKAYNSAKERCDRLERGRIRMKWQQANQKLHEGQEKYQVKSVQLEMVSEQVALYESNLLREKEAIPQLEIGLNSARELFFTNKTAKEVAEQQLRHIQEHKKALVYKEKKARDELQNLKEALAQAKTSFLEQEKEKAVLIASEKGDKKILGEKQMALEVSQEELSSIRSQYTRNNEAILREMQKEKSLESAVKEIALRLENKQQKGHELQERSAQQTKWLTELLQEEKEKQKAVQELLSSIESKGAIAEALAEKVSQKEIKVRECAEKKDKAQREINLAEARQKALEKINLQHEGASHSVKKLLQEAENPKSSFFGKIALLPSVLSIPQGKEKLVALHLRNYTQTLVVETENDLKSLVEFAREAKFSNFSIICREWIETSLLDHFLEAIEIKQEVLQLGLDKESYLLDERKVLFHYIAAEESPFLRHAELSSLEESLLQLHSSMEALQKLQSSALAEKKALEEEKRLSEQAMRSLEMKLVEQNYSLQRAKSDIAKAQAELAAMEKDRVQTSDEKKALEKALEEKQTLYEASKKASSDQQRLSEENSAYLEAKESRYKRDHEECREAEASYRTLEQRLQQAHHAIELLQVKQQQIEAQMAALEKEVASSEKSAQQLFSKEGEAFSLLQSLEGEMISSEAAYQEREKLLKAKKEALMSLEASFLQQQKSLQQLEQECQQLKLLITQIEAAKSALKEESFIRFGLDDIPEEKECLFSTSLSAAEKEIAMLLKELEAMGNINLAAIDECALLNERYSQLKLQLEDLERGKKELEEIILQLEEESRGLFAKTFEQVRSSFKKNFEILFNGGEADLTLEGSSDLLLCGIGISAKPPGKQMRSIQLLSGGEKCLTAMALLFAIFEVKPAPFCILDEIDAPLDDANVERFGRVVKQFIDRSQFIVVTHNKRTMALGDILFGVSMEEKGVSKVLAMAFNSESAFKPDNRPSLTLH
jgi:chromosome segregation protein